MFTLNLNSWLDSTRITTHAAHTFTFKRRPSSSSSSSKPTPHYSFIEASSPKPNWTLSSIFYSPKNKSGLRFMFLCTHYCIRTTTYFFLQMNPSLPLSYPLPFWFLQYCKILVVGVLVVFIQTHKYILSENKKKIERRQETFCFVEFCVYIFFR